MAMWFTLNKYHDTFIYFIAMINKCNRNGIWFLFAQKANIKSGFYIIQCCVCFAFYEQAKEIFSHKLISLWWFIRVFALNYYLSVWVHFYLLIWRHGIFIVLFKHFYINEMLQEQWISHQKNDKCFNSSLLQQI